MPGLLESVLEQYAPVRRTWEQAFQMSEQDCFQLCHWALRNGSLPKASNGGRPYLLSARNWITYCTEHAENKEAPYMLPDGKPNCGFFFGRDTSHQRNLKQIVFWHWLAQQKERGLTAGGAEQISRTRVEYCTAFLNGIGHLQFRGCEREGDSKYGVLEKHEQDQLRIAKVPINNLLGAQDERTQDPWNHTKGKDLSIEQMRAVQAVTAVSWSAAGNSRIISHFMLLGLQALALHCWTHSRRTVFSKCVRMNGLSMDSYTPESAALQDVSGSCKDEEAPLIVYRMVGSRDKGHGGDKLVCGMKSQLYKSDTFIRGPDPTVCLPGVLARYMHLRNRLLPIPLGSNSTLAMFEEWALQPLFQTQISTQARSRMPGHLTTPFMHDDSEVRRTARHIRKLYETAGINRTPNFLTRRLRQGGGNAALQLGLAGDLMAKRMGHNSSDVHVKNYTAMMTDPVPAMAAIAGHAGRHIQLGRTAISAREGHFKPLYDEVSGFPDGARERLHGWLAHGHSQANSFREMWKVLEHLPDVLLQDLVALQHSRDSQVAAYYTGLNAQNAQLAFFHWGDLLKIQLTSVFDLYPFLEPDHELHPLWLQYQEVVSQTEEVLHARNPAPHTIEDLARMVRELHMAQGPVEVEDEVSDEEDSSSKRSSKRSSMASDCTVQILDHLEAIRRSTAMKLPRLRHSEDVAVSAQLQERLEVDRAVKELADKTLLMPQLHCWQTWSVEQMYTRFSTSGGPGVPSPERIFKAEKGYARWLKLLQGARCKKAYQRAKGGLRIWQNLALKIGQGSSLAEAVQELQSAYERAKDLEIRTKRKPHYQMEKWWQKADDEYGLKPLGCCDVFWEVL